LNVRPERLIPALKRLKSGSLRLKSRDTDIVTISAAANEIIMDLQNLERRFWSPSENWESSMLLGQRRSP